MSFTPQDKSYMRRCFDLARRAQHLVKSNPMVGAVLVYKDRVIGEGYHVYFGGAHAEVNAISSVSEENKKNIPFSTLYVSLEPCCIHSKTPACTDLIIKENIKEVIISCQDPNPSVAGNGVRILESRGIAVKTGLLEQEGMDLIRPFRVNILKKRPYIILKFAQSKDGFISKKGEKIQLSNSESQLLNHKWRTEVDGIMVGTNTALIDDPRLTARHYEGSNPIRIVMDKKERIPKSHHLISDAHPTLIFTEKKVYNIPEAGNKTAIVLPDQNELPFIMNYCFDKGIYRLIIEGGKALIESFVKSNLWDECRVIKTDVMLYSGTKSPLIQMQLKNKLMLKNDHIYIGYNKSII